VAQLVVEPLPRSRLAPGTPVWTSRGVKPVETLRVGDRVLGQDPHTGALIFDEVVGLAGPVRSQAFKLGLEGGESLKLTTIERVWVANRGWVAARDLKAGDSLRSLNGRVVVAAIDPIEDLDATSVVLADHASLFAGSKPILVHDNSIVHPTTRPFDALVNPAQAPGP
jgi:hypothetical protein